MSDIHTLADDYKNVQNSSNPHEGFYSESSLLTVSSAATSIQGLSPIGVVTKCILGRNIW